MNVNTEFKELTEKLAKQRDEIELKLHLAGMDAKEEWGKAENKWGDFKQKLDEIADDTKETTDELVDSTKIVAEEIKSAYQRIVKRLND